MARDIPTSGDPVVDRALTELLRAAGATHDVDLIARLVITALELGTGGVDRGELKISAASLSEQGDAYRTFARFRGIRKAAVFGSARTPPDDPAFATARHLAHDLAEAGWMTITGAGPGIMAAATEGAGPAHALGVAIALPFEPSEAAGALDQDRVARFRYFFNRKLIFMKEADAYVLFPGGFGTMDETFELLTLLQTGKEPPSPVILFEPAGSGYWTEWRDFLATQLRDRSLVSEADLDLFTITSSPTEAVNAITSFYRVFHSIRQVGTVLVVRCNRPLSEGAVHTLNAEFGDLLVPGGRIRAITALTPERRDDDVVDLPRIGIDFDNAHFARLHRLVRRLGELCPDGGGDPTPPAAKGGPIGDH